MLDRDIRERLFLTLENDSEKLRVFEEVVIGKNRCDFFTVTDRLTGYEIKSDSDSYARLKGQVKAYDRFFNENCLVVGRSHLKSAPAHIPDYWGIVCVGEEIEWVRRPQPNPKLKPETQLALLWKRELRHILARYSLPAYPHKSRTFIAKRLVERLDPALLLGEICQELFERDYVAEGFFDPDEL